MTNLMHRHRQHTERPKCTVIALHQPLLLLIKLNQRRGTVCSLCQRTARPIEDMRIITLLPTESDQNLRVICTLRLLEGNTACRGPRLKRCSELRHQRRLLQVAGMVAQVP